ncbi:unnamed protein product, partial [marine sediment metagenome]
AAISFIIMSQKTIMRTKEDSIENIENKIKNNKNNRFTELANSLIPRTVQGEERIRQLKMHKVNIYSYIIKLIGYDFGDYRI